MSNKKTITINSDTLEKYCINNKVEKKTIKQYQQTNLKQQMHPYITEL